MKKILIIVLLFGLTGCALFPEDDSKRLGNFKYTIDATNESCNMVAEGRTSYGAPPVSMVKNSETGDCTVGVESSKGKIIDVLMEQLQ